MFGIARRNVKARQGVRQAGSGFILRCHRKFRKGVSSADRNPLFPGPRCTVKPVACPRPGSWDRRRCRSRCPARGSARFERHAVGGGDVAPGGEEPALAPRPGRRRGRPSRTGPPSSAVAPMFSVSMRSTSMHATAGESGMDTRTTSEFARWASVTCPSRSPLPVTTNAWSCVAVKRIVNVCRGTGSRSAACTRSGARHRSGGDHHAVDGNPGLRRARRLPH